VSSEKVMLKNKTIRSKMWHSKMEEETKDILYDIMDYIDLQIDELIALLKYKGVL